MPEIRPHRNKELHWHHIDFKKCEIMLWVGKQGSAARRKRAPLHPEVVKIFAKWKEVDNLEHPIPHAYIWIWKRMKEVKQITGLNFTNHDLRRLKAQLTEKKTHDVMEPLWSQGSSLPTEKMRLRIPLSPHLYYTHPEGWQSLAECTGLENQQGFTPFGGSNPSPSAMM